MSIRPDKARFAKPGADWLLLYPDELAQEAISLACFSLAIYLSPLASFTASLPQDGTYTGMFWPSARGLVTTLVQIRRALTRAFLHSMMNSNYPLYLTKDCETLFVPCAHYAEVKEEFEALEDIAPIPCPHCRCGADLSLETCRHERLSRIERLAFIASEASARSAYFGRVGAITGYQPSREAFDEQLNSFNGYLSTRGYTTKNLFWVNGSVRAYSAF